MLFEQLELQVAPKLVDLKSALFCSQTESSHLIRINMILTLPKGDVGSIHGNGANVSSLLKENPITKLG